MKVLIPDHSLQPLRSAIKLEIGYCISHLDIRFKKGASFGKLNFFLTFVFLRFLKAEEVRHITFIPSDSHSGFYFPPSDKADGFETTACLECDMYPLSWTHKSKY